MIGEAGAAEIGLGQAATLDHGPHGAVHDENAALQQGLYTRKGVVSFVGDGYHNRTPRARGDISGSSG